MRTTTFARRRARSRSRTFIAHVRFGSTGAVADRNTHPFEQHGRLFGAQRRACRPAGVEARLGDDRTLVIGGDTDSERLFALVTTEIRAPRRRHRRRDRGRRGSWVADTLPVYSLNFVLTTPDDVWALRYPEHNPLLVLWRGAGGPSGQRQLDHASVAGTVRVRAGELAERPAVVVASERMDEDPGWRELWSGELLRVDRRLRMESSIVLPDPPAHPLELEDLSVQAAASQEQA